MIFHSYVSLPEGNSPKEPVDILDIMLCFPPKLPEINPDPLSLYQNPTNRARVDSFPSQQMGGGSQFIMIYPYDLCQTNSQLYQNSLEFIRIFVGPVVKHHLQPANIGPQHEAAAATVLDGNVDAFCCAVRRFSPQG